MKKYRPLHLAIALFASMLLGSALKAQTQETPDSVRFKTLGCLYRSIQALNDRNVRFKALQEELENMHPLEPQSMDSAHFAANLIQVAKYLSFLESHRQQLSKNIRLLADTIHLLAAQMNKEEEKKALMNFLNAYREESSAFIGYSQRLSLMLTDIRAALVFLQTVPMERKGNDITFDTDKSANEKYLDFESRISIDQAQVDKAIDRSIKMTEKENKVIQETLGLLNK
ncbi:MAG: hypothetical protein Q8919_14725 [Bacteroidota bacterium]|nr:hypothetical protein [Bacteroidota bacterium]